MPQRIGWRGGREMAPTRRTAFALLAAASLPLPQGWSQTARKLPVIAYVAGGTAANGGRLFGYVKDGLRDLGWQEGRDYTTVAYFADGYPERLPGLSRQAVNAAPDLIVAGAVDAALELRKVTSSVPIVSAFLADAVHLGLVSSNAHPGFNVTGIEPYVDGLPAKQFEIARQMVPAARRIGILGNLNDPKAPPQRQEIEEAARRAGTEVSVPEVRKPTDLAGAVDMLAQRKVDIAIVLQTSMTVSARAQIAALTAARRLPALYGYREHVDDGGLISYGVSMRWCCMRLATFVQKILTGAQTADLPVEFPPRLEMVINAGTARALGIAIPQILLARADEVID